MVDPAKKATQAPAKESIAKPAGSRGVIKRARLVFTIPLLFLTLPQVKTLYHFNSWFQVYQLRFHIFVLSSVWEDLSNLEKDMYTRRALDLVCLDCGKIGSDGFKHMHRCQDDGYRPMEVVNFIKGVRGLPPVLPRLWPDSFFHSLLRHLRLPSLMCTCGKSFYNKSVLDLHVGRCHGMPPQLVCADGAQVWASTCLIHSDFP